MEDADAASREQPAVDHRHAHGDYACTNGYDSLRMSAAQGDDPQPKKQRKSQAGQGHAAQEATNKHHTDHYGNKPDVECMDE